MKTLLSVVLLFVAVALNAATGDLTGAWIPTNGYSIRLRFAGMATNGTVDNGMGTNSAAIENAKLKLSLTSWSLTESNTYTTSPVSIVGTKGLLYPATTIIDTSVSGSDVIVHVALSKYVFAGDSNLVASATTGLYVAGGVTNTTISGVTVTNLSVVPYQPPIGNWTITPRQLLTNTTFTVKAFAMSAEADLGRPVKSMIFTLTDGTTTLTNTQTEAKRDMSSQDQAVVCEHMATFVTTNLTQGAVVTANFIAIPWRGTNFLNTADGVNVEPSTRYCPIKFVNDWKHTTDITNSYGRSVAIVDPSGTSATAKVQRYHEWLANPTTNYFANMKDAYQAIYASNNTAGWLPVTRGDVGGAIIYVRAGNYATSGASTTPSGAIPECVLTITADPSTTRTNVIIDGTSSNVRFRARTKWDSVTVSKTNTATAYSTESLLWFNNCIFNQTAANWASSCTNIHVTYSYITNYPSMTPTGGPQTIGLFRGNRMDRWVGTVTPTVFIGNVRYFTNSVSAMLVDNDRTGVNEDSTNNIIIAFNRVYGVNQNVSHGMNLYGNTDNNVTGTLIVQNEIEATQNGASCVMNIGNSTSGAFRNIGQAYNTYAGKYIGMYNDNTSNAPLYEACWRNGNITFNDNLKSHLFTVANALRTNNFSVVWGVGDSDNWYVEVEDVGAAGSFLHEFAGIRSYQNPFPTTNTVVSYVSENYYHSGITGTDTPGVYRFNPKSKVFTIQSGRRGFWGLPYDLYGNPRSPYDPPGARVGGNYRITTFAQ